MSIKNHFDPNVYKQFESGLKNSSDKHMTARIAFGALYAYYKSNQGTRFGIDFWESKLEDYIEDMHAQEVVELMVAFKDNRQLERSHMIKLLDTQFKKVLLDKWNAEVVYNQRVLFGLVSEFHSLGYYDEELWTKIVDTAINKTKINNTHFWQTIYETMCEMNDDEKCPMHKKLTSKIDELVKKHFTKDREWRYSLEKRGMRSLQDLIDSREESKIDDHLIKRAEVDEKILVQAREAEKRLKRLKMAKYSVELFDEIIEEMMRDKKTIMEMMAELDVDDNQVYASQTRIAKRQQAKNISELKKKPAPADDAKKAAPVKK